MSHRVSRREFIKSIAAVGAAVTIVPSGLARTYAANEKVNVACIGVGNKGWGNLNEIAGLKVKGGGAMANIVGICDVDGNFLAKAKKEFPKARTWVDYRRMLPEQKDIDAVMVSTADHSHYPASIMAIKLGKGVCTEKPMTHSIWEARQLALAAKKYGVATQMDQEKHAHDGLRMGVEWIKSGAIGTVREMHVFTNRPIWPQGIAKRPATKDVPKDLNWDLWLGPAPYRDYHESLHPFKWRGWWDFGTGALGDMGCHFFDLGFWALDLGEGLKNSDKHPIRIEAVHEGGSKETYPNWSIVTLKFPARGKLPPVTVKWYDGGKLPERPAELAASREFPTNGSMFVGDKGKILVHAHSSPRLIPEEKMKDFERPEPFLPRSPGHKVEWLNAVKGGEPASSNFTDYGGPLCETVLLGNLAVAAGKRIEWDAVNLKARSAPEVSRLVRREYREGWDL